LPLAIAKRGTRACVKPSLSFLAEKAFMLILMIYSSPLLGDIHILMFSGVALSAALPSLFPSHSGRRILEYFSWGVFAVSQVRTECTKLMSERRCRRGTQDGCVHVLVLAAPANDYILQVARLMFRGASCCVSRQIPIQIPIPTTYLHPVRWLKSEFERRRGRNAPLKRCQEHERPSTRC